MKVEIGFSSSFKRTFKKVICNNKKLEERFWINLSRFEINPHDPSLKTHKLTGELNGLWSFSIEYDCRIIFRFAKARQVILIDIGSHNEVY